MTNNKKLPDELQVNNLFDHVIFKILSEPIRLEILKVMVLQGPMDINSIASHFSKHRSVISRHLKQMYEAGILIKTKEGTSTIYQVDGMSFLHKMESVVLDIKQVLSYCCEDLYQELYDKKMNYGTYLSQQKCEEEKKEEK